MREILFRGKRVDNGLWVKGCLRQYPGGSAAIRDKEIQYTFKVDPETVGQYTGVNDKNGRKIFEDDIIAPVLPGNEFVGSYEWPLMQVKSYCGSFCLYDATGRLHSTIGHFAPAVTLEVKGNIHDNPELLGGETHG